jgi:hypothetical protein
MSERENLTTSDLAESPRAGEETAEDLPLTREHDNQRVDGESDATAPLLPAEQSGRFEQRWHEIQASFVDEPRQAVEQADTLVAELMQELASGFSDTRSGLEAQWDNEGEDVSTEDLRVALTRYRSFFNRLLSA